MIKRFIALALLVGVGLIFTTLMMTYEPDANLNLTAHYYAEHTANDVGSANIVTAILVTYRGLDTLGEVTVLFLASSIIGLVLSLGKKQNKTLRNLVPVGELLTTGSLYLAPIIVLLGVYVFVNGHLTPGGGFPGGAIIASSMLLLLLSDPLKHFSHGLISFVESISGFVYVALGVLGIVMAGSFLDNRILPLGQFGELISAGAIPLIYSLIGLKVGAEFSSMLANLSEMEDL
ncbi:MAG: hydrogen gas-evolving membrane-bound hydrogenase subunit E [Gallionella sp.]|nr:hydrogen gas-evolving membrane-bound hydrogenase subunit E [Gallionella sp.]